MILQWIYIVQSTYIFSFQPHTNYYLLPKVDMLMRLNMSGSNSVEPLVVTLHGPYEPWTCSWERQTGNTCWWTYIWNAQNELYLLKDYIKGSNPWTKYRELETFSRERLELSGTENYVTFSNEEEQFTSQDFKRDYWYKGVQLGNNLLNKRWSWLSAVSKTLWVFEIPSDIDRVMSVLVSVKVLLSLNINEPSWRLLLVKAVECGGQMKTDAAFRPMKGCENQP